MRLSRDWGLVLIDTLIKAPFHGLPAEAPVLDNETPDWSDPTPRRNDFIPPKFASDWSSTTPVLGNGIKDPNHRQSVFPVKLSDRPIQLCSHQHSPAGKCDPK
jgi:hypothetical protein